VQCGPHKIIQCWSNPDSKIQTNTHHTQSPKFPFGPRYNRIFSEYKIQNPCEIRIIYSGLHQKFWSVVCTTNKTFFKRFWMVVKSKTVFLHVFLIVIMASLTFFNPPPINSLHFLKNSHTFFFLLFSSPTMCFHRWSFIERGLFENPSGVIWSVKKEGVSLGVRLVCLGVILTIMVSCYLEAPGPLCLSTNNEATGMSSQPEPLV